MTSYFTWLRYDGEIYANTWRLEVTSMDYFSTFSFSLALGFCLRKFYLSTAILAISPISPLRQQHEKVKCQTAKLNEEFALSFHGSRTRVKSLPLFSFLCVFHTSPPGLFSPPATFSDHAVSRMYFRPTSLSVCILNRSWPTWLSFA